MIRAYRVYTGGDGNSHVCEAAAQTILFKEKPAHSYYD